MHINVLALTAILKLTRAHMQPHRETNTRNKSLSTCTHDILLPLPDLRQSAFTV